jgi:hypothetical protein
MCPVWKSQKVSGTFLLAPEGSDTVSTNYHLDTISLAVMDFDGAVVHKIAGEGSYRVGEESALMHQLILDINIDGDAPIRLDSGLIPGGSGFPLISIPVSRGTSCFDIQMDIKATSQREQNDLPDVTSQWTSFAQTYREARGGMKCRIGGKLTIQNIGGQSVRSSFLRYYLSKNGQYNEGTTTLLKEVTIGTIQIGKSKTKTFNYSLPLGETATGKYIIAVIDAIKTVTKANENNDYAVFGPIP